MTSTREQTSAQNTTRAMTGVDRRAFLRTSATLAAVGVASGGGVMPALGRIGVHNGAGKIRVGVIGCGGRGTGAAVNTLEASPDTVIVALGDMFKDHLDGCREELSKQGPEIAARAKVADDKCFTGFDAYQKVLACDIDMVILATPPGFRPTHFKAAVDAGKHIFFEKPVATDAPGIRTVIEAARKAQEKKLSVVTGTQRRHENCYLEAMKLLKDGAIGKVLAGYVFWNQEALWHHAKRTEWSDMEWQLRNWLYFTWLSGDHIVEQHVHNLDVANWVMGGPPVRATGMGGRQTRTGAEFGHIFDHFAIMYEYADGQTVTSMARQMIGCDSLVEERFVGEKGKLLTSSGRAAIAGEKAWQFKGDNPNPYMVEHKDLIASIQGTGPYLNEGVRIAESTLTAIMGRMSAYTGKVVTFEKALNSTTSLAPTEMDLKASIKTPEVAVPGRTPLV